MHGGAGGVASGRALAGRLPIDWSEQAAYMHARGLTLGFAQVGLGLGLGLRLGLRVGLRLGLGLGLGSTLTLTLTLA